MRAEDDILIYTTRPDTLWGATFMVLAPEHPLVDKLTSAEQRDAVEAYRAQAARQTEIERTAEGREKTGVWTGGYAINPVSGAQIPVWIADYVMISYGTGAIMAVPYGDQRDFEFARKFGLEIIAVVQPQGSDTVPDPAAMSAAYDGPGIMVNSGPINGTVHNGEKGRKSPAIAAAIDYLEQQGIGKEAVNYRLRDWLISRQRYWGSPIPVIHRQDGTLETVPDADLPVLLPDKDVKFMGPNPLSIHEEFRYTTDSAGNPAERDTDTMDTFMCSSWYWYRYLSPQFSTAAFDPEEAAYWLPVDTYTGGAEHATMHLLYARWFAKAMRDTGMFDRTAEVMQARGRDPELLLRGEPFMQLRNQGQILGEERNGDVVFVSGTLDGTRLIAEHVIVLHRPGVTEAAPVNMPAGKNGAVSVRGEIMRRTERTLQIAVDGRADWQVVEVAAGAKIEIPGIEGENTVNQLRQHLEVQRMSKSKGNVVNPDELVKQYGADTVRAYLMFAFDWAKGGPWDSKGIQGVVRWLDDVWAIVTAGAPQGKGTPEGNRMVERKTHQTIGKVSDGMTNFSWNTAVAGLMELRNTLRAAVREGGVGREAWQEAVRTMLLLMAPITPHIAEELWAHTGGKYSVHTQAWPQYDAAKAAEEEVTLVVQAGSRVIDSLTVPADIAEDEAIRLALASAGAQKLLNGREPKKTVFVPGREKGGKRSDPMVNIVV